MLFVFALYGNLLYPINMNTSPISINKKPINITVNISPINIKIAPEWNSCIPVNPDISSYAKYRKIDARKRVNMIKPAAKRMERMPNLEANEAGSIKDIEIKYPIIDIIKLTTVYLNGFLFP